MTKARPDLDRVIRLYDTHRIYEAQILESIRAKGVALKGLSWLAPSRWSGVIVGA
jgi:hypothetical protein